MKMRDVRASVAGATSPLPSGGPLDSQPCRALSFLGAPPAARNLASGLGTPHPLHGDTLPVRGLPLSAHPRWSSGLGPSLQNDSPAVELPTRSNQ